MNVRLFAIACSLASLAACMGGVASRPAALVPNAGSAASTTTVRGLFVSPATRGMTVNVAGPTHLSASAGLTLNASGCHGTLVTLQCALSVRDLEACPSKAPCYNASVTTYDAFDAAKKRIPPGAHELAADRNFTFAVVPGTSAIAMTLAGIPKSVVFVPAVNSVLSGNQKTGFVLPKCSTTVQTVTVTGVDADGNYIAGPGAPVLSLVSGDPAQLAVEKPAGATNDVFALEPPALPEYPFGNHAVSFTVTATPNESSGAQPVTARVTVTYGGEICGHFTEFRIPTGASEPYGIAAGPDGNLWFTEHAGNKVGRITTAGKIVEFPVPTASSGPAGIVTGPNRERLWFAESSAGKIAKMTTAGSIREYRTPTADSIPFNVTVGPDRNLWFTEQRGSIAKITTAGTITEYSVPTVYPYTNPYDIAAGPDGALWFTEFTGPYNVGRITTAGSVTEFSLPAAGSLPVGIVAGADKALWFTQCSGDEIGRITTHGTVTSEYPLPTASASPAFTTLGPDGNVWFGEIEGGRIGRITTGGAIRTYRIPTSGAQPYQLTVGPDGALWFTESAGNKIARLW